MKRKRCLLIILFLLLPVFGPLPSLRAAMTWTNGVEPIDPLPPLWDSSTDGYIGRTTDGALTVDNSDSNSHLLSHWGWIGTSPGVTGQVTITGSGSTWDSTSLFVGDMNSPSGSGVLNVLNGGCVTSLSDSIGYNSGSTGAVRVEGIGTTGIASTYNSAIFKVGYNGHGTLDVTNGGIVNTTSSSAYIGFGSGSTGTAIVDGVGSQWNNDGILYVGYSGSGTLNINRGGLVRTGRLTIDHDGDGDGFVNMSTGGMLALPGDADDTLASFVGLINGTDAIRYWDDSTVAWANLTGAAPGTDYAIDYIDDTGSDLFGYTVLAVLAPGPVPGDVTGDRVVNELDAAILAAHWGKSGRWADGDFNDDGFVDARDASILAANWGSHLGEGNLNAVPEPGMIAMLMGMAVMALSTCRSRQSG